MIEIVLEFFKIGLFSIGGGLATLPFLFELANRVDWINSQDIIHMVAVAESSPGPIGINTATYVGYHHSGVFGGIVATISEITPSIIIIIIIYNILKSFRENKYVNRAFIGMRACSLAMICASIIQLSSKIFIVENQMNLYSIIFGFMLLLVIFKVKIHPIFYIFIAGFAGAFLKVF